jgi:hypothetical protein
MTSDWAAVDVLIRQLGAVRAASFQLRGPAVEAAIEQAIREASQAVLFTFENPRDADALGAAGEALRVAEDVIAALDAERARSHDLRARALELSARSSALTSRARDLEGRAREIVEQARLRMAHEAPALTGSAE